MLNIWLKEDNKTIRDVDSHFNLFKEKSWFEDDFVRKVIREIDKSEVISGEYIESPVFGGIPPAMLSGSAKALILMRMSPEFKVYATRCGDSCVPLILELAESQDVNIVLHHCMRFPNGLRAIMMESGKEVHTDREFVQEYYRIRDNLGGCEK